MNTRQRYLSKDYISANPTWDSQDSPWKAQLVASLLTKHQIIPSDITDIGCGAGTVLLELRHRFKDTFLTGFDIATDVRQFWEAIDPAEKIQLRNGDFLELGNKRGCVVMMLDVVEHLQDPFDFLARLHGRADWYVFHFPLDLSALSVAREEPLLRQRKNVGHIHYYTKGLALALLVEAGFGVVDASYTGAGYNAPMRSMRTGLAKLPRKLAQIALGQDLSVRILGGETLLVLAKDN